VAEKDPLWDQTGQLPADARLIYVTLEFPTHPNALLLLEYWCNRSKDDGFVVGRDIPARPIAKILHILMVNEPIGDIEDMNIRLAGSSFRRRHGRDITGEKLSSLFAPETFERLRGNTREILRTGKPCILDARVQWLDRELTHYEILVLPVLSPDRKATWMLVGLFYF
jgi:hypothetical protein